jgi:type I restriction enzyme S subunit
MITAKRHRMKELCEITSSKRIFAADYQPEGIPFYRGKEITEKHKGNLDVTTELFIDPEKFEAIRAKFGAPVAGDLLLTSVGTLGSPYVVRAGETFYFKDGNLTWFRKLKGLDSRYLYYWLLSPHGRAELKKCTIGSSQSAYTIVLLKDMEINLPDLPTQCKIAGILSAYDDLIENNLRRIKILEEMAQSLYREWFVHFRFPGHESTKFVDSPLGQIPKGWEVTSLGDLVEIRKGKNITKTTIREGSIPVVAGGLTPAYYHDTANTVAPVVTISASGANAGFINIYFDDVWASDCSFIDGKATPDVFYFFLMLISRQNEVTGLQRGSAQPHVYPKDLMALEALRVLQEVRDDFTQRVTPLFESVRNLHARNQILRRTRDLLLPKLLNIKTP